MANRTVELIERWKGLQRARGMWPHTWEDVARVMAPRRLGFITDVQPGERRTDELFDGTAMQAARMLANAVGWMLRPEGEPWLWLKTADDADEGTDEARDWLADTENRLRDAFDDPRARFRHSAGEVDFDLVTLGTGVLFVGEIVGGGQLLFQSVWLKEALPFFGETGNPEGMFRSRRLSLRQASARWGVEKLSEPSRLKIADNKLDETAEFLYCVVPREEGRMGAKFARNMPIADIVIETEAKHEVFVSGFPEFPYIVPRWDTTTGEDYGHSPGMIALPDANTSQAIGETMLIAGQRAADPPILHPSDAFISAPNTYPGGLAPYEADAVRDLGPNPIRTLEGNGNFPLGREIQLDTREQIWNAFYRNVLRLPVQGPQMTAEEIIARKEEIIREVGPVFGRQESDYTAPMVERAFKIMLRAGAFLPVPESLQGRSVRFEYESPVKKMRQLIHQAAASAWVKEHIEAAVATGRPEILDPVNFNAYSRFSAKAKGIPHELVNSEDEIKRIREERQAAAEAANEMAMIQQGAATAKDAGAAAKSMGEAAMAGEEVA